MAKRKALLEFKTHHYIQEYSKTKYYCVNCGAKDVWVEDGEGDYYVGPDYICLACDHQFNLPSEPWRRTDE